MTSITDDPFFDRALGCVVGLAIGDAVGTTVEFLPRGGFPPVTDMIGQGPFRLSPGQWTDDTSMALCLAESLLAYPDLNPLDLMQRFQRWLEVGENSATGTCFDIGKTTLRALSQFKRTQNPIAGSTHIRDSGNGSIMRLAPVAAAHWRTAEIAEHIAQKQSATTHQSPLAMESCAALARILCRGISGMGIAAIEVDDEGWLPQIRAIGQGAWRGKTEDAIESTGYVLHTMEVALWSFAKSDSFEDTILTAVNLGHDSDTTGAVAGQIAGAIWGFSAIPDKWVAKLYEGERIYSLAKRLYELKSCQVWRSL